MLPKQLRDLAPVCRLEALVDSKSASISRAAEPRLLIAQALVERPSACSKLWTVLTGLSGLACAAALPSEASEESDERSCQVRNCGRMTAAGSTIAQRCELLRCSRNTGNEPLTPTLSPRSNAGRGGLPITRETRERVDLSPDRALRFQMRGAKLLCLGAQDRAGRPDFATRAHTEETLCARPYQ